MKLFNIFLILFLLSAFSIGISLQDANKDIIDSSIDNASLIIDNISFENIEMQNITNSKGILKIVESGIKFVGTVGIESIRTGIHFGHDNPQYFSSNFIIKIAKLIVILTIVTLLIKPLFYVLVFLVMIIIWIFNKKKRNV